MMATFGGSVSNGYPRKHSNSHPSMSIESTSTEVKFDKEFKTVERRRVLTLIVSRVKWLAICSKKSPKLSAHTQG